MEPTILVDIPWTRRRLMKAWSFIKILRVEPYMFLIAFQFSLKGAPGGQLLQDKICMQWFKGTTADYCRDLPKLKEDEDYLGYKNDILAKVAQFGTYHTYLSTVPALIWAMFVGAWIDRYVRGRKILMIFSVSSAVIENLMTIYLSMKFDTSPYYNLLLHLPTSIFGGHIASRIAITHYMSSTTPPKLMALRFMIFEMCMFVASPIGSSLGGYLLVQKPMFHTGEIRNYSLCFIIALAFEGLAFLWIVFMVNEKVARKQEMDVEMKIRGLRRKTDPDIKLRSDMSREDKKKHPIRLLFDLENIKLMVRTVIKERPNKVRSQLFLLFMSMIVMIMAMGGGHVSGQFIQRVYHWGPDYSSYMGSITMIVHGIATVTIVAFLIRVVKVNDIPMAIIGYCTTFTTNLIKGTYLSEYAYYICLPIGSIGGISSIGTRSHLTKIVGRHEIGKVMSFMSALDTLAPMVSTTLFAYIFKYTVDSYPGTVFQVTALLILVPIYVMMWIDLFTERPLVADHRHHRRGNRDENQNEDEDKQKDDQDDNENEVKEDGIHERHHKYHRRNQKYNLRNDTKDEETNETSFTYTNDNVITVPVQVRDSKEIVEQM